MLPLTIGLFTLSPIISGCSGAAPSAPAGTLGSAPAERAGAELFASDCAICHGPNGDGQGLRHEGMVPPPADLTVPPWSQAGNAGRTFLAIRQGVARTAMAPWPMLSDEQIWQLVAYIETLPQGR
ncbi:MAG TPA: cytochrome c [Steroidobacteraceae bacterium]|nr:cytochrome c [Steroidobacteraceae bacterium]